jgi:predicted Zn-dependent protease
VNLSPTRPRRLAALALAVACSAALAPAPPAAHAQNRLPALGDAAGEDFAVGTERRVGDHIMREIRRDPAYLDDPVLLEYVQGGFGPLLAAARRRGDIGPDLDARFAWEPFLVRDRSVNAFALPGGYIGVHLGLLAITATRDEFASVLAHELSHVTQRHIARSIDNSKRNSLIGTAATLLAVIAASRSGSGDMASAAMAGGQAAAIQGQLNFSRDMEREADRIGFALMTGAGFAGSGMASMFERLALSSRLNDTGGFPYLRSHPLTTQRIGEARARLGADEPAAQAGVLEHTAAQARARVLMDTRVDALRRWQSRDADDALGGVPEQLAATLESALASTLLRDWSRADAALAKAQSLLRGSPRADAQAGRAERAVALLRAESLLERGNAAGAAEALDPYAGEPSRPVLLLGARLALARDEAAGWKRAAEQMQTWVSGHPDDAPAWTALAQLWGRLGERLRALRAEAEAQLALGDLAGAVDRLRAGQRAARGGGTVDFIEASVIDARLREVEARQRQLAQEARELGGG